MRLEDMKSEFPKMPEEMREMIEREVDRQVKTEHASFKRGGRVAGRTIAASVAAVKRLYVAYTDVHYVMEMFIASDVAKEEALKMAEGIRLVPTDEENGEIVSACNWSDYQKGQDESAGQTEESDERVVVAKEEMANTHAVGESFLVDKENALSAKITDVQIADDLSLLDPAHTDEDMKQETDGNGKLIPADIQYVKEGSADALSEVISSRQAPQKLVYATVEYTNTGTKELSDVLFFGNLLRIAEKDGQMEMPGSLGYLFESPSEGDAWTNVRNRGYSSLCEMQYYDVTGGERGNNYIDSLLPGETKTVHMGWIVTEEELDYLYVSLDTFGGAEFSESSLEIGYVDIRQ